MPWHCWFCLRPQSADIKQLNYRHCTLSDVPAEVFAYERTLEELYLDSNRIRDLPRQLFHCHGLKILSLSDNEVCSLPTAVASLINLQKVDVSRNALTSIPDNIKGCKHLTYVDVSVNPLEKLPEGFTQLISLEELYLNDTYLDFLPANFGRLLKLRILELRENNLNTLPKSIGRLTHLQRLDLGQNEFSDLPEVIGSLPNLTELWIDSNRIRCLPTFIGNLKKLIHLEASNNNIQWIAPEIQQCVKLIDLTISSNELREIPDTVGNLKQLMTLKLDDNQLTSIPSSIGKLANLEELILSQNDLESLNPCIGLLRKIHILNLDDNMLEELPPEIGSCTSLTILSAHSNRLQHVPAELGHLSNLHVINLSENHLQSLPVSILNLVQLTALWLSNNQSTPLTTLQPEIDKETGQTVCTNFMLPQSSQDTGNFCDESQASHEMQPGEHPPKVKPHITFASDAEVETPSRLMRAPTPYPKELRAMAKHARAMHHPRRSSRECDEETPLLGGMVSQEPKDVLIKEAKVKKPGKSPLGKMPNKTVEALESTDSTDCVDSAHNLHDSEDIAYLNTHSTKNVEVSSAISIDNTVVREAKCVRKVNSSSIMSPNAFNSSEVRQRHSVASSTEQTLQQPPPYHIAAAYSKQAIFFRQAEVQSPGSSTAQLGNKLSSLVFDDAENYKEGFEHSPLTALDDFNNSTHEMLESYLFEEGVINGSQHIPKEDQIYSEPLKSVQEDDVPEEVTSGEESPHLRHSYIPVGECFYPTDDELRLDLTQLSGCGKDYFYHQSSQSTTDRVQVNTEMIESSVEGLSINMDDCHQHTCKEPLHVYETDTQSQIPESVDNTNIVTPNREVLLMQKPQTFTQAKPIVSETVIAPTPQRPGSGSPTSLESLGFIPTSSSLMSVSVSPSITGAHGTMSSRKSSSIPKSTARIGPLSSLIVPTKHDSKPLPSYWQSQPSQHATRIPQPGFYSSSCSNYPAPKMDPLSSHSINQQSSIDTSCNLSETGHNYHNHPITDSNRNISPDHSSNLGDHDNNVINESNVSSGTKEHNPAASKIPMLMSPHFEISSPKMSRSLSTQQSRIPAPTSTPVPMSALRLGPTDAQGRNMKAWMFGLHKNATVFPITIRKSPGLGFSITGSLKSSSTEKSETGIFVTKLQPSGPASGILLPGDKILEVDGIDFTKIQHEQAVRILKQTDNVVNMMISRQQT